jgi:hypothetical protein
MVTKIAAFEAATDNFAPTAAIFVTNRPYAPDALFLAAR